MEHLVFHNYSLKEKKEKKKREANFLFFFFFSKIFNCKQQKKSNVKLAMKLDWLKPARPQRLVAIRLREIRRSLLSPPPSLGASSGGTVEQRFLRFLRPLLPVIPPLPFWTIVTVHSFFT